MASFPVVQATNSGYTSSSTTHNISMPSGIVAGDRLVVMFATANVASVPTPAGWTLVASESEATIRLRLYTKVAEGGDTLTLSTSPSGYNSSHISYRIVSDNGISADTNSGASDSPDPPSLTPAGGSQDYLWMVFTLFSGTISSYPANYTDNQVTETGGSYNITGATYAHADSSENPGTFSLSTGANWIAFTVAVEAQTPQSASFSLLTSPTSSLFAPSLDFAGDGNFALIESNSQILPVTAKAGTKPAWTSKTKSADTWTNKQK